MHSLHHFLFPPHDNLIHLLIDHEGKQAAVIDPAWRADEILLYCQTHHLHLSHILLTHTHHDHVNAASELLAASDCVLMLSANEQPHWQACPPQAVLLQDGDEIELGESIIRMLATPGHTPGSCCYLLGQDLFSGDTLFIYGCGRADFPNSDIHALYTSLQKLRHLSGELQVHPGHNYATRIQDSLANQWRDNPFFLCRDEDEFIRYRSTVHSATRNTPYAPMDRVALLAAFAQSSKSQK